ncbi:MAG: DNA alkylation repair protein [Pyrinomonadaceae bacterium]|nr:DNA alkylation repair protein [Pyrinomonadaceae bacterium]
MNKAEVLTELESLGSESTKRTLMKHGAREPFFGVKVADLKKVLKKIKNDQKLALELYRTGNSDAMYLAGLAADGAKMSESELDEWVKKAYWSMLSEYAVPWVASEHENAFEIGLRWIESEKEEIACAGWCTLANVMSMRGDEDLDIKKIRELLKRIEKVIHSERNRVRYTMNGFVIAAAAYVAELTDEAVKIGEKIGKVSVEMDGTACKVPFIPEYVQKIKDRGRIGIKKKTAKC